MFDRFTDCARAVMRIAREQAQKEMQETVSTFLILAAILREGEGGAVRILQSLGVDTGRLSEVVQKTLKNASRTLVPIPSPPLSEKTRHALEFAAREADALHHPHIGSEHLLLGMLNDPSSPPAKLLGKFGVTLDQIRDGARRLQGESSLPANGGTDLPTPPPSGELAALIEKAGRDESPMPARRAVAPVSGTEETEVPVPPPQTLPPAESAAPEAPGIGHLRDLEQRIDELEKQIWEAVGQRDFRRAAGLEDVRRKLATERRAALGID